MSDKARGWRSVITQKNDWVAKQRIKMFGHSGFKRESFVVEQDDKDRFAGDLELLCPTVFTLEIKIEF